LRDETLIAIIAIISLAILEAIALINHLNSALFGLVVGTISGIVGYNIRVWREKK